MKNQLLLFLVANCLLLVISYFQANAFKVVDHDLEVAASHHKGKHWEKGDEHHHYGEEEEEKGEKGHKGYESKHG